MTGFEAQSFKKNQESLYYIRHADIRFLVVIIVFNKINKNINHREGFFYSLKVHRFTALSDLIFDSYAGLYGCNDRVLITEFNSSRIRTGAHDEGVDT